MVRSYDSQVSIVLTKDVLLTPETLRLLEGLGISPMGAAQYELVGSVLSHKRVVNSLTVLKMRVTAILREGLPFAGMDDVLAITINNIVPIKTLNSAKTKEEVYKTTAPLLTNNIGIMPNEELVIRRSGALLSLAHQQFEIQLSEQDLTRIKEKSIRKQQYAVIVPDTTMWRVVAVQGYSFEEVLSQVTLDDCLIFKAAVDTGYYSTNALFNFASTVCTSTGEPSPVLSWLRHLYEYGELAEDCDVHHPLIVKWLSMVQAPDPHTDDFTQFMAFQVSRHRSLQVPVRVEGGRIVDNGRLVRPRDFFAQFDEVSNANQS